MHLVRVEWLIDSIYIHKRMKEEDYQIRSFRNKVNSSNSLEERQNSIMNNSLSFHSLPFNSTNNAPLSLNSRKSISAINSQNSQSKTPKELKVLKKYESTIFKGYCFYVESTQKKEIELHDLPNKITKNGGEVYISRADIKHKYCFYVLKDSSDTQKLI